MRRLMDMDKRFERGEEKNDKKKIKGRKWIR